MIRRALLGAVGLVLAIAAPAGAQIFDPLLLTPFGDPGTRLVSLTTAAVRSSGAITVVFGPDAASGCAAQAGCAYHGRITLSPASGGDISILHFSRGGRSSAQALLGLGRPGDAVFGTAAPATFTDVQRGAGDECADATGAPVMTMTGGPHGGSYTFSFADALGATRCAGPLPSDLAAALPRFTISTSDLSKGRRFDLRQARSFASHGFAGTVTSTLVLTVSATRPQVPLATPSPSHVRHLRVVSVALRVTGSLGDVTLGVRGSATPGVCALLDTCGLAGTMTLRSRPTTSAGALSAFGPPSRPQRDFLTALGLARGGRAKGISVLGDVQWSDGGTVISTLRQGAPCTDTASLGGGLIILGATADGLSAYSPFLPFGRTRCPGPVVASGLLGTAKGVGRHKLTVTLRPYTSVGDDGYTMSQHGSLTLTLHRGPVTSRLIANPFA
jgi:hypothetical protein